MIPQNTARALPKSNLFWIKLRRERIRNPSYTVRFAKFRIANAMFVWIGPVEIGWRMPWLEGPARQLYPHLFNNGRG